MSLHHPARTGIVHHPDEDLLLAYAGGTADEATGLILAAHMAYCAVCRLRSQELDALGGSLLQELSPVPMSAGALDVALAKLDRIKPFERAARPVSKDGTPAVLQPYLGGDLSQVRWRRMGPGLSYAPLFRSRGVSARLLRGAPGADSGPHSHAGLEYTLVLRGGFTDVTGNYGPGDLQVTDGSITHNPIADPGEDCINLAVTTGRLKFEHFVQKIVAPWFGF